MSNFLNLHSLSDHEAFCLAYVFTYRDFTGGTLGLAWVASASGKWDYLEATNCFVASWWVGGELLLLWNTYIVCLFTTYIIYHVLLSWHLLLWSFGVSEANRFWLGPYRCFRRRVREVQDLHGNDWWGLSVNEEKPQHGHHYFRQLQQSSTSQGLSVNTCPWDWP